MRKLTMAAAAASCAIAAPALADTKDVTIHLEASVAKACTLNGDVATLNPGKWDLDSGSEVTPTDVQLRVLCSNGTPYTVTASSPNDDGGKRRLKGDASLPANTYIGYNAYWGAGTSTPIPKTGATVGGTGDNTEHQQVIRFVVPADSSSGRLAGDYSDDLTLTFTF